MRRRIQTDLSAPAIIAYELGCLGDFRFPSYGGPGGLPINIELLLRRLERDHGHGVNPLVLFTARQWMDELEDYWERGGGSPIPRTTGIPHNLAMYGWDLRDALEQTVDRFLSRLKAPKDGFLNQMVENDTERAALRIYPTEPADKRRRTVFDLARELGDEAPEHGIETLVVFLGANNALPAVTHLRVKWSEEGYDTLDGKKDFTVWRPEHFAEELALVDERVRGIKARHVICCTVPHVTIAPICRGVDGKSEPGSRYFPHYTRPWISDRAFDPDHDPHITAAEARAVDSAIDQYNDAITEVVRKARTDGRDWYLVDLAGVLDRLADRRYIEDPAARPQWWAPYPLPAALAAVEPPITSHFLNADGWGGRARGGLFSLDGVHPTTVGYGVLAQEIIRVMHGAGVEFRTPGGTPRPGPVEVDFARLLRRDTLVTSPPQNIAAGLAVLGWADEALDLLRRALPF
ncbi:hypothetical protein [Paractinoplanes lichenicola]|uniref:SGNH hydrolase-type esterase domain-containing protein n=1 Tax=Paractinoplanes lichenicola TaxID=2802976 RepID=A0ABS1VUN0_9ACTN|nr:hypothetical protein [Actinoplanes lichenicola]MBL7258133.1 hypothetical protein [Actinoplanes lichenicola]